MFLAPQILIQLQCLVDDWLLYKTRLAGLLFRSYKGGDSTNLCANPSLYLTDGLKRCFFAK